MKLSQILYKQHIGRQTRFMWYYQGKRVLRDTKTEERLTQKGIKIWDPNEVLKKTSQKQKFDFSTVNILGQKPPLKNEEHPDWHERPCLAYKDDHLLTLGLPQAQQITKTVVFENQMPESVESLTKDISVDYHNIVQKAVKASVVFDAHQVKLPSVKDPSRPAWVFPRDYGLTTIRKTSNLSKKLFQLSERMSGPEISNTRSIIDDVLLHFPFEKESDLYKFSLTMDMVLMSEKPLSPAEEVEEVKCNDMEIPSIEPMHCSIGLEQEHIYKTDNHYPLIAGYNKKNIHTVFTYYDPAVVKHVTELPTTEDQVFGRALLKVFTAAASQARQRFGMEVKNLPEPITVQCIQSDGVGFYFSVYQLNTLDIEGNSGIKNYCWTLPKLDLYNTCSYMEGKPVFFGYNREVFKRILAFYRNN